MFWRKKPTMPQDKKKPSQAKSASTDTAPARSKGALLSLESRLMFDAAAAATASEVNQEQVAQEQAESAVSSDSATSSETQVSSDSDILLQALSTYMPNESRTEIVFVDQTVPNYQDLLSGIDPTIEVVMLDGGQDGVEQMANVLAGRTGIDAIHLISHGDQGQLNLGTATLTQESMTGQYADELATIRQSLSESADILVYGCDFAEGEAGQAAVNQLATLTGADVAAGTDSTESNDESVQVTPTTAGSADRTEVIFIDGTVADYEVLVSRIQAQSAYVEVIVLDSHTDGVQAITAALSRYEPGTVDAVHILSHGVEGGIQVGSTWINQFSLQWQADIIASWGQTLTADADIMLWGCNVASTAEGQTFVNRLAEVTGADVAASTDATGHVLEGGDWQLEYATAQIETQEFTDSALSDWIDVLAISANGTATSSQATGVTSLTWSHTVASGSDRALFVTLAIDGLGAGVNSVTYGGVALTQVGRTSGNHAVEIWRLVNPTVGAADIVVNLGATTDVKGGAVTYNGVNQGTPTGTYVGANGTGTTASVNVSSATGGLVLDVTNWDNNPGGYTTGAGQSSVWNLTNSAHRAVSTTEAGAATVTMSSTVSASNQWEIGAVSINASVNVSPTITSLSGDSLAYSEGAGAVVIEQGGNALVADSDSANFDTGTLTVSFTAGSDSAEDVLSIRNQGTSAGQIGVSGSTITYGGTSIGTFAGGNSGSNLVITLNSSATPTAVTALVKNITYQNTDTNAPTTGARTVRFVLTDGDGGTSANYDTTVTVSGVNDAPSNTVPSGQNTNEDTSKVFSSANGNQISISDPDGSGASFEVTVAVTNGTLTLSGVTGLTFTAGDGTSDSTMTFRGTVSAINTALNGLTYNPTADYSGSATLTITSVDNTLVSLNIDANLQARYTFEGTANDVAPGTAQNGTLGGDATYVTDGTRGQVLSLDGVDDYVQIAGRFGDPANVTLTAWVNLTAADSLGSHVISLGDSVLLTVDEPSVGNGVSGVYYNGSTWVKLPTGQFIAGTGWHHVAYIFDDTNNTNTLYIDGTAVATATATASISYTQGANSFIGKHGNGQTAFDFNGQIDDARVYNRALTASEVAALAADVSLTDTDAVAITVTAVNDVPTISNLSGDSLSYSEGAGAVVIEQGANALVADIDSTNFDTGTLTISIPSGGDSAEDVLSILNQGTGAGQIGVSGSTVTYGGVTIGTFTGGSNGTNLVITLNSSATPTAVTALIKNITYENTDAASPTTGARTVRYVLTDGDGGTSANYDTTVTVTAVNDAPVLALGATNLLTNGSFESGGTGWTGNSGVEATTRPGDYGIPAPPDGTGFLEVEGVNAPAGTESYVEQTFTTVVGQTYVVSLSAITRMDVNVQDRGALSINGVEIGRFTTGTSWQDYAVSFTATSTSSTLQIISKGSLSGTASLGGDAGGLLIDHVQVVAVQTTVSYTEGGAPVVLAGTARVFDAELSGLNTFSGATLTLARNGGADAEDIFSATGTLSLSSGNLIVSGTTIGTYTNSSGTLQVTFNASATNTLVNSAMQQIAYSNSSDTPPASAQIDWTFSDGNNGSQGSGGALSATGSTTVTITAVNDAPTITNLSGDGLSYSEGDGAIVIEQGGNALVADVDSTNFDTGTLTVSFAAGSDSVEDVLSISNQGTSAGQIGVSGSNITYGGTVIGTFTGGSSGSNLVITFNSNATPTAVTALVQNITYENTDTAAPTTGARTVRYVLTDGDGGTSANYDTTVTVSVVNDAPTFGVGDGQATTSFGSGWEFGKETILQPDGKILVAGYSDSGGSDDFSLTRYNADGTLDTSFGGGDGIALAGIVGRAETAVLQPDGKIVLSGYTTNGGYQVCLVRFNVDGTLDTSFGGGDGIASSGVYGSAKDVALQTDGKFLVAADLSNNNFNLMRFNSDGSLDTSYGGGSGYVSTDLAGSTDRADSLTIQSDGKVVLAGFGFNGTSFDFALVRYNTDGSLDTSFNGTGKVLTDFGGNSSDMGNEVRVQADGKIVVAGWSDTGGTNDVAIARYNANGTLDTGFGIGGKVTIDLGGSDLAEGLTIQADGKILVTGTAGINGNDFGLVRLNTDGSLDTTFSGDGIATTDYTASSDDRAYSVAVQSDGHIVVSGTSQVGALGEYNYALTRYTSTGALDTTLDPVNTLDGTPNFTEGGSPVVLDGDVQIFDAELSALDNFNGATLTLARNGGANAEDQLVFDGVVVTVSGSAVSVNGVQVGTYTFTGGEMTITFNGNATQARVNTLMQHILYYNVSDAPPGSVQIDWTFNDGNSGAQGTGGALQATGSTTVTITPVNDAPTDLSLSANTVAENAANGTVVGTVTGTDSDVGDTKTYSFTDNAGGRFAINSSTGQITVADGSLLNYEAATNHSVTVRVTDSGGLTYDETFTINLTNVNEFQANDDSATTLVNTSVTIDALANDTDPEGDAITVLDYTVPTNGTVTDNLDGTLTYTPDANYQGADSFDYLIVDSVEAPAHYWRLDGDAMDLIGTADGTVTGATTVQGHYGDALSFDEVNDYVTLPDVTYASEFSISFMLKVDDLSGTSYQYLYSHGVFNTQNSISVFLGETGGTGPLLYTRVLDANDSAPGTTSFDVSSIVGDGQWHTYTLTISASDGMNVYLDGDLKLADSARGKDGINPSGDVYLGARQDLESSRFFGGAMDSVAIYDYALSDSQVMTLHSPGAALATVNVTVDPNSAPTDLSLSTNTVAENASNGMIVGTMTGTDPNASDTKTYSLTDSAGGRFSINSSTGVITVADGSLLNYEAATSHNVTVRVTDSGGLTYDETFTINVTNVNEAPTGTDATITINEDTSHALTTANFGFSDVDAGDSLSAVRIDSLPGVGTLTLSGVAVTAGQVVTVADIMAGNLVFTPVADTNGTGYGNFTFSVRDSNNAYDAVLNTLTFNVTAVNDPTVVTGGTSGSGNEDTTVTGTLTATDVEGVSDGTVFTVSANATNGTANIDPATGLWSYTPNADWNGSDSFTVTITDDAGNTATQVISVTVSPVVDITNDSLTTAEDTAISANVLTGTNGATADSFEGTPVLTGVTQGANGSVTFLANGTVTYTPNANFTGTDSFTYTITSGGMTETATVTVTVTAVNDATVVTGGTSGTGPEDAMLTGTLTASDADGLSDGSVFTVTTAATNGTASIDPATGLWSYTPNPDFYGTDSFTVTITDDAGNSSTQVISVTVTAVVDIINDSLTTAEDTAISANVLTGTNGATADSFEGTPVLTSVTQGANGSVTFLANGTVTYTPNANFNGSDSFTYTITSGGVTETATVTVNVTAVNDAPVVTGGTSGSGNEDTTVTGTLTATDAEGLSDGTVFTVSTAATNGTASIDPATGLWSYTPTADWNGSDSFTVTLTDDAGNTATQVISVTVTAVNDAPVVAVNLGSTVAEGGTDTLDASELAVTDVDNGAAQLAYTIGSGPAYGRLELTTAPGVSATTFTQADIAANRLIYVHDGSETTSDNFTFTVNDGAGGSLGVTTMSLTITPVNDTPTMTSNGGGSTAAITVAENVSAVTIVTGADVDLPVQAITYSISGGVDQARFTINSATGALNFTVPPDFEAAMDANGDNVYAVQVRVTDSQGASTTQTIQVTVTDVLESAPPPSPPAPVVPPVLVSPLPLPGEETSGRGTSRPVAPVTSVNKELIPPPVLPGSMRPPLEGAPVNVGPLLIVPSTNRPLERVPEEPKRSTADERETPLFLVNDDRGRPLFSVLPVEPVPMLEPDPPERTHFVSDLLMAKLDEMTVSLEQAVNVAQEHHELVARVAAVTGTTLSVGFVAWALRSGAILASCLATMPAWRHFDPLPVVKLTRHERSRRQEELARASQEEAMEFSGLKRVLDDKPPLKRTA